MKMSNRQESFEVVEDIRYYKRRFNDYKKQINDLQVLIDERKHEIEQLNGVISDANEMLKVYAGEMCRVVVK